MFHVPPGMIEQQLVLVLDVCKTLRAHIKIRKTCHSNTFHLRAILTAVNNLKFWRLRYTWNENHKQVKIGLPSHQQLCISDVSAPEKLSLLVLGVYEDVGTLAHIPSLCSCTHSSNKKGNTEWVQLCVELREFLFQYKWVSMMMFPGVRKDYR